VQPEGYPEDGQEQQPAAQRDAKDTRVHTVSTGAAMAGTGAAACVRSATAGRYWRLTFKAIARVRLKQYYQYIF